MSERHFRVIVLVENSAEKEGLVAEHGLSLLVESGGTSGLFDTGQSSGAILGNARCLGVDLGRVSWIVLSHGHYDHTGGLNAVVGAGGNPTVFAHPEALAAKYVREASGKWRSAGIPITRGEIERAGAKLRCASQPVDVASNVMTTGEIPRTTDFESAGDAFFTVRDGRKVPDPLADDQALVLRTEEGVAVLLGCAHAGVVNTLRHVLEITGEKRIRAVLGGMHLGGASRDRISKTIAVFRELEVEKIGLAHCTGRSAEEEFAAALGERCFLCPTGTVVEL